MVCTGVISFPWIHVHLGSVSIALIGNRVFADESKLKQGHTGVGWALLQWQVSLQKNREIWTQTYTVESLPRKMEVENGIILPEANHHHKFLATTKTWKRNKNFNLESLEAAWLWWHLDFRFLAFRTVNEYISVILINHPVCETSSWWLWETNSIRVQALNEIHWTHRSILFGSPLAQVFTPGETGGKMQEAFPTWLVGGGEGWEQMILPCTQREVAIPASSESIFLEM